MKRIIKTSLVSFIRNGWLSTATVLVMTLTIFVVGALILLGVVASSVLSDIENKIDIAVYFYPNSEEADILNIQESLRAMPEVKDISYISQEAALAEFKERHKNDAVILGSLDELDSNPLEATLNIKAHDSSKLSVIADHLEDKNYPIIDKINYFENRQVIERLSSVVGGVRNTGLGIILVLAAVAVLVAFNTIRIAIWSAREEINIMRLVGASGWFIRGPFLLEGVMHGAIAGVLGASLFYPLLWAFSPKLLLIVPSINLYSYFQSNFLQFAGILVTMGVVLGAMSSFIAVRKYLKV